MPAKLTKLPGWQLVHAVHELALLVVLKLLAAQAAHVRSVVALPALDTD